MMPATRTPASSPASSPPRHHALVLLLQVLMLLNLVHVALEAHPTSTHLVAPPSSHLIVSKLTAQPLTLPLRLHARPVCKPSSCITLPVHETLTHALPLHSTLLVLILDLVLMVVLLLHPSTHSPAATVHRSTNLLMIVCPIVAVLVAAVVLMVLVVLWVQVLLLVVRWLLLVGMLVLVVVIGRGEELAHGPK